ncbi:UNVERIFIED_CONTAM: Serine/threonine-protein kinase ATR [Sesamum angustifolium]|uniref:non-specific serine/threonine protein kinase n=1 Tax=Sesamum angustifolium TaxID=2727405 RepID=A0AAW2QCX3_9LAMI
MANLSSLVHELRERIAASSSTPPNNQNDEALESRFRAVLPNLLHAYVVPSSSAREREVIAILKLLSQTAKNFPGVFYHGKASAVLPVIGRILPFFAEPAFRPRQGTILETVGSLLSLLRTGDRDAYRQFFVDAMLLSEDLVYVASFYDERKSMEPKRLWLKSFCESFARISNGPALLGDLPICNRPACGEGILIDLTETDRFLAFAASAVKLLSKCLTEGTLYVEGLLDASCVLAVCNLLCYGDDNLHMACFDFARLIGAGKNFEVFPFEKLIRSITIILSEDVEGVSVYRSAVYDSSLGGCLQSLHSVCPDDVVRLTAADIVNIFPKSMLKTRSFELKAGLCSAYVRIAKTCPPYSWRPECLICMLLSSESTFHIKDCFKVAVSRLGPNFVGRIMTRDDHTDLSKSREDSEHECSKVGKARSSISSDVSIFLEAVDSLLLFQGSLPKENRLMIFENTSDIGDLLRPVLKVPWSCGASMIESHPPWKAKYLSIRILSRIGCIAQHGLDLDILDLGLHDEEEEVRIQAVISMPVIVLVSGFRSLMHMFNRLETLKKETKEQVKKFIALCLGHLACLYGCCNGGAALLEADCKLYLKKDKEKEQLIMDYLLQGFWCSRCGSTTAVNHGSCSTVLCPSMHETDFLSSCDYTYLQSLFFELLYDESSEVVQVACVRMIGRILMHGTEYSLLKTRSQWVQCIDFLILHQNKNVRQAFGSQISFFLQEPILECLFSLKDAANKSKEQRFMDKLKHALAAAEDPLVFETLLETAATIMEAVDIHSQLFLFSLILVIGQLDNCYVTVRFIASKLINRSCYFHHSGGLEELLSKVPHIRNELYNYLCMRLVSQPKMVEEFSAAVLGIETEELVKRMIPVVLPKLVVLQNDSDQALATLYELAKCLNTDMVQLIVNWLPKVLAFALHQAHEQELKSALQFYHEHTGSDNQEIFAAALPALLDELICFSDVDDPEEISKRLDRVPHMIEEVARILTGSEDLPGFLRNHVVGLLNSIDRKMLHAEDTSLQKQAVRRIEMLIKLMGSHLSTYVPKIMVLLMHAINKAWLQEILEELVVQNKVILKQHIREFPTVPNVPALAEVNKVIQEVRGSMTLKDQLHDVVDGLNHENLNVRYMVASELSKLLNQRTADFMALFTMEGDSVMDIISSLITSLLKGCAEESRTSVGQRLKLICADCLGAIGAIDPAKVKGFSSTRFKIACSDDDLIFELIHKHLARAFRAAPDTIIQDSAALAIQELLKIAGCEASLDENVLEQTKDKQHFEVDKSFPMGVDDCTKVLGRGQRLWDRFSNYVKEIIAPCLTSRFQLPNVSDSAACGPIYRPSMSFRRWIYFWIKKLTAHATGSRSKIFNACRGIVRHDMQVAMYLLPYLVLNAVCDGTEEARSGITEEILSVLDAAASDCSTTAVHGNNTGQGEVCIQAVFTLLDNLGQWVDDVEQELALSQPLQSSNSKQQAVKLKDQSARLMPGLLLYFESYVRDKSGAFNPASERNGVFEDEDISFLMEVYSGLDEPDGLSGLASLRKSKSLQDHLLINKKAGNWAEVLTSCEQALQMQPFSVQRHSDVLNCLLNMCHLQAMVTHVDGLISRIPQYRKTWCTQGVQAAWRLGRWDLMSEYLTGANEEGLLYSSSESNAFFDKDVAQILQAMMKKNQFLVAEKIALSKQALIAPLAAAGMDSYARAYPFVVKLHLLRELEDFNSLLNGESFLGRRFQLDEPGFLRALENWESRLKLTQPSLWAREPLLAFRRLVFSASGLSAQVGNCWRQYAKLCRSSGHYETANRAILEAKAVGASNVHIEKAKLLWSTRRADGAIAELQQSLLNMPVEVVGSAAISSITSLSVVPVNPPPLLSDTQSMNENLDVAKTLLLYSRWIHYTGQKQKEDVINLYSREDSTEQSVRVIPSNLALVASTSVNSERRWWTYLPDVLLFYAKGLHRGHKNLFQALPRLLTLWFDFGSFYYRSNLQSSKDMKNVHGKVMSIMRGCLKDLPTYQWLTVLPQLVSRICHQNEETVRLVKHIITSVLRQYPQQALWTMAAVTKSTVSSRRDAAAEIIQAARRGSSHGGSNSMFVQFASLVDHLIRLCFHPGQSKARTINILTEFSALKRMMPVDIIMPTQESLTVNLPSYDVNLTDSGTSDIFSYLDLPTITGIADEAEILSSLQRPKKIILMGSDGSERPFLCKPKDDLRKDARMMEFNAMINRLLSKCAESRRRKLYIRTFAVSHRRLWYG